MGVSGVPCLIIAVEVPLVIVEIMGLIFMYVRIVGRPFYDIHEGK